MASAVAPSKATDIARSCGLAPVLRIERGVAWYLRRADGAAAAPLLPLAVQYATQHYAAVKRAGHEGNRLTLVLNGQTTVDVEDSKLASGPFALQWGRGVIKWRKVEVKAL